jgi:transketolase
MYTDDLLQQSHTTTTLEASSPMPSRRDLANAIRALSMDAIQKANSGHPGMPMGMADISEVLWNDFLKHNPANPSWINRDRFILSNGHGAMLHYALLHLTGYNLSMEDLKRFRQLKSRTPGHPEYGYTPGVETTTGPLGQGLANAVGMAIAEKKLAAEFNRDEFLIIDHYTYVFLGDGCLMEGISHEVCSLAGVLGLGKLIAFYDDNGISIDGEIHNWHQDDTPARFQAYGWHVIADINGHDADSIKKAILEAKSVKDKPTLICCQTIIAYGAPNLAGTSEAHGAPLGAEEIMAARKSLGWNFPPFVIPDFIYSGWDARSRGKYYEGQWKLQFEAYSSRYPELADELIRRIAGKLPPEWKQCSEKFIESLSQRIQNMATRKASNLCLDAYGPLLPELIGGSADLTGSNLTWWQGSVAMSNKVPNGNYIYYGVREFGMFAIMNGMALHGGLLPYGGTFLTFADYGKNAIRLSALMKTHVIYVLTHDSIGLGEDGPTHQPIEHIAMLRLIPNLYVWRPADALETAYAWKYSIEHKTPTCLLLSRQNITAYQHNRVKDIAKGGYTLIDSEKTPDLILIATGSELSVAVEAALHLKQKNIATRVVSMPCLEVFEEQSPAYREQVLPQAVTRRIVIEAGATATWYKYVGFTGKIIGIDQFGASAPYQEIFKALGITVEHVVSSAQSLF